MALGVPVSTLSREPPAFNPQIRTMSSDPPKRIIPHDRAPKSTPSREQLKIDLRLRCERRLRESLADNRRSLMQSRRESGGGGGGGEEDAAMLTSTTMTTTTTSSLLSPTSAALSSSSSSGVDAERREGQIFNGSSTGPTLVHNMLQEIFADEMMMHTPITDRGGGGLIRPYRPGGLLLKNGNDLYDNEDDFTDPLSDNELFEMLLEIETSVLRQQEEEDKKAEEEEEEPPSEPDYYSFKGQYGRKQLEREKGIITKFKFTTSEGGGGGGFRMVDDHDGNEKDEEGEEENDLELLSAQEEQMRKDEEDAYYARLAENND